MKQVYLSFFALVFALFVSATAFAHDIEAVNANGVTIYYKWINDSTELAVSYRTVSDGSGGYYIYHEYTGNVVIPESVIYNGVAYSVTSIDADAFESCSGLLSVTIPRSVVSISSGIFAYSSNLTSIIVDAENPKYDSRDNCNAVIETNTNTLIAGCSTASIPLSVTTIGENAFEGCQELTTVVIPANISSIGRNVFLGCGNLTTIVVDPENPKYDSRDNCNAIIETDSRKLITGCKNSTIPNSVSSIGEYAFYGCSGLTSVEIPDNIINIGTSAFRKCGELLSVKIGTGVTVIEDNTFQDCSVLKTITIGSNVQEIKSGTLANCNNLGNIISLNDVPPTLARSIFTSRFWAHNSILVQVPIGSLEAYRNADVWKNFTYIIEGDFSNLGAYYIIDELNFPDERFREYLINEPFGRDRVLTEEEIAGITTLDVSDLGISDLKGIEYFTALKKLLCYKNNLTELNLSANKQLKELDCYSNHIMGIKMDSLLACLPTLNDEEGSLFVFDATNDGNICFTNQVAFANSKGWTVYYYTGHDWQKYEGREKCILIVEENFPDEYFRKYLMNQDYGKDMVITDEEIKSITSITISGDYQDYNKRYLKSLKGIEYFTSLTSLFCSYNLLTELNVSNNKELTVLCCPNNSLKSLDISSNVLLTTLVCDMNGLTKLDVSKNTSLTSLSCHNNQLTSLDVSKNKALTRLTCADNKLTEIDVSKNTALTYLFCAYNQLTSLDVSKNGELTELACMGNQLTKLDVSKNLKLTTLKCQRNNINEERMDQMIEGLPNQTSGKLYVVSSKNGDGTGGNVCTKIQVRKANDKGWEVYCGYEYLGSGPDMYYPHYQEYEGIGSVIEISEENFPDMNFRNFLLSQDYVHGGAIDSTEILNITQLIIDYKGISSLQGIEFFTALKSLNCSFNQLMLLDVSKNTALEELYCGQNSKLTTLDVSKNKELIRLNTYGTPLTTLNVSGCTALQNLACYWGQLTSLDVSECPALTSLNCNGNLLTSLDVSKNTALKSLYCYWNQLTSLDVSGCTKLQYLECNGNQLTALDMSGCKALQDLVCSENQLTSLNIANNTNLQQLHCSNNKLNTLSLPVNSFMIFSFSCYQNQIKGKAMDALIESLPISNNRTFYIIYNDNDKEGNKMTTTQVAAAKAKGWTPYYTDDGKTWQEYFGDDSSGIQHVTIDNNSINVYDLNGRKLKEPSKGINILSGKKILIK